MSVELAGEGGEEDLGEGIVRVGYFGGTEQDPQMRAPEPIVLDHSR